MKRRTQSAQFSLGLNLLFALYHGILGIWTASWWLLTVGAYYSVLSVMRFAVVRSREENGTFVMRAVGVMFFLLSVILIGTVYMTLFYQDSAKYHEIVMITMALYAFSKLTFAVIRYAKGGKDPAPLALTLRSIAVADASVSIFTLQRSMLVSFEGMNVQDITLMNALTGTAVWVIVTLFGINLVTKKGFFKMAKSKLVKVNEKIAEGVTKGYKKIEEAVVGGYKKIEDGVVGGYTKLEDKFVEEYLTRDGETVEEAKKRLKKENE